MRLPVITTVGSVIVGVEGREGLLRDGPLLRFGGEAEAGGGEDGEQGGGR
jgi:hypothetical protein